MRILFLSAAVGFITGVITFFLSLAFLCFVLLILGAVTHTRPDMTLTFKAAAPVAVLAAISGFTVTLVRGMRAATTTHYK
jgi:hypothetical protein